MDIERGEVAIVGAGLVGLGWAIVFALAGRTVRIFDADPARRAAALGDARRSLEDMQASGLIATPEAALSKMTVADSLQAAVAGAAYIQESVFETVEVKRAACEQIDQAMQPGAVAGSSSSGIPASAFTEHLTHRDRFFVVHPVNPPHLVPVVEIVPAPWSDPRLVPALRAMLTACGQAPVALTREVDGFILNRLQGALLNEAWALFAEGYASAADIDLTVSQGLGLRWSFMGPFETIDLNAPGGIEDYARRLSPLYHGIALSRSDPQPWPQPAVRAATQERRAALPADALVGRRAWRDRRLMALRVHQRAVETGVARGRGAGSHDDG